MSVAMRSGGKAVAGERAGQWSVKTMLRMAFAIVLAGTVVIGGFSLWQISRLDASMQSIYEQGHIASQAAEEVRANMLRASRAQKGLLTATTAQERNDLGAEIDHDLAAVDANMATLKRYSPSTGADAADLQKFSAALAAWHTDLHNFVTLVQAQPLDLTQMNWQVGTGDVSLFVETGKLETLVDALVARRGALAKRSMDASAQAYRVSCITLAAMTLALGLIALAVSTWVDRKSVV